MKFRPDRHLGKTAITLLLAYAAYISLGLPDTILGVAWPFMRREFGSPISHAGIMIVLITAFSATASFCSGFVLRRIGIGRLLTICGLMTGSALFAASFVPSFPFFLILSLPLGLGSGAIDVGMSYYVAHHFTSRHMIWLHGSWGIGATLGPSIVTLLIGLGLTWRAGYAVIGFLQLLLAIAFFLTLPLWNDGKESSQEPESESRPASSEKVVMSVRFWTCALMFFAYCSIENSVGLWGYQLLTQIHGVPEHIAGYFVSCFWGGLMLGRFLIGSFANRLGNRMLIRISTIGVMAGGLLLIITPSQVLALIALLLVGFSFATIYPSMMHETPQRFNRATAVTLMGFQSGAGVMGFGLSPSMVGFVAARTTFGILPYLIVTFGLLLFIMQVVVDGWTLSNKPEEYFCSESLP